MTILRGVSIMSVLCTVPILMFVVPALLVSGVADVSGSVEYMVVVPTLIGLPCALLASIVGAGCVLQRRTRTAASVLITLGQLTTIILGAAIVVWAVNFGTTGWELLALPWALIAGQILVTVGLICWHRRTSDAPTGTAN
jgi:hypothetical protein